MSFLNNLKTSFAVAGVRLERSAPTIGTAAGVVGIGATAYLASRATLKAGDILEEHKAEIKVMDEVYELHKDGAKAAKDYDEKAYAHEHALVWVKTITKFTKLYAPAIAVGVCSAALIIASHNAMNNRLASLGAAYTVLQNTFAAYRERIEEHFGKEEVDKVINDREENYKQVVKRDIDDHVLNYKTYARIFGEGKGTTAYVRDPHANVRLLSTKQNYWNDRLEAVGFVFLNEIYEDLGYERVPEGQNVGWLSTNRTREMAQNNFAKAIDNNDFGYGFGDGYIDFGIFESSNMGDRMAIADDIEWGGDILLEFNIDPYYIKDLI